MISLFILMGGAHTLTSRPVKDVEARTEVCDLMIVISFKPVRIVPVAQEAPQRVATLQPVKFSEALVKIR